MKICIDPGHGGNDPGCSGNGIIEKSWALELAERLAHNLRALGADAVLTRTGDSRPALTRRSQTAVKAGCNLFISIHCNAAANTSAEGAEVFYAPAGGYQANSQAVASTILAELVAVGLERRGIKKDNQSQHSSLTVLRNTCKHMPAVLVEFGFASSAHDARLMRDKYWREKIAKNIAEAIVK